MKLSESKKSYRQNSESMNITVTNRLFEVPGRPLGN